MIYNLWGVRVTMMERGTVVITPAAQRRGSEVFYRFELPRKQRRAWDMWTDEAIETLRQMALEGKSASASAVALVAPPATR